jgi:hypothetical protein
MPELYDYHGRIQNESWLITHIQTLIFEARLESSTSSVLYAAFETRNLIEKICYDLILMSSYKTEWDEIKKTVKGKKGIRRNNDKYKTLKYKVQTFSSTIARLPGLPIKPFDYTKAVDLENDLGEYVHTYTRTQEEMNFASDFIQDGIVKIEEALNFILSYFVKQNQEYIFGTLNFSTLTEAYKTEFENWKKDLSTDTEALFNRLLEINKLDPIVTLEE